MRFIYYTNNTLFVLTLLGYTVIIPGLAMQMVLGVIQVLFFIVFLFNYEKFSKGMKQQLVTYGMLMITYLFIFFNASDPYSEGKWFLLVFVPMIIGSYFTYIVHQLNQRVL
jgi:hypothetical protein